MRKINFNAGPAGLPLPVLERAQAEFLDYQGTGMSILEHSHRGKAYEAAHREAIALFAELLGLPPTYDVILLQGGASLQFAMLPMNFLGAGRSADYLLTGHWAKMAFKEAGRVAAVRVAADCVEPDGRYVRLPKAAEISIDPRAAYVHMTSNNTIFGTQWRELPDTQGVPLVSDMSSDILSKPIEASRHHLIYAGAQKNLGPSGLTVVAVRKDWLDQSRVDLPDILRYKVHIDAKSLYHTPPSFAIYLFGLNLKWIKANGGAAGMQARNEAKAQLLYGALDRLAGFFKAPVEAASRSRMNIVFRAPDPALDETFCAEAEKTGMAGLKGHRSTGGMRASLYNAVSFEDVKTLVSFMENFARRKG